MYDIIKEQFEKARKERDTLKVKLLSTLIGEIDLKRSTTLDFNESVVAQSLIKKFIKDAQMLYAAKKDESILTEIEILESFMPKALTDEEIIKILEVQKFEKLPEVMGYFKNSNLTVDMKRVRELFQQSQ